MSGAQRYTVLITDLVDSTKLATELGDARVVEVWLAHDRAARDLLPLYNGREVDKSDGFLMLFERPVDGVRYSLAYHAALRRLSSELGLKLRARAGLHAGEVSVIHTPAQDIARGAKQWEVEGLAKPTAARIMSVALGGQTLLSASTAAEISEEHLDFRLLSHGFYRMKGVADPLELIEAGGEEAPLQPPPDAAKVYRVVPTSDGWRPAREVPNNLAPPRVGFFGRAAELRQLADTVEDGARLVTLTGSGGTGKTTLALRYAASWLGDWPGGAWFGSLSEARDAIDVARGLGVALSVPLAGGDPVETVGAALASRGPTLVVLDNFEQVVNAAARTVGRWLDLAPQACFLVTSRQRLGLRGERVLPVEPLPLPDEGADRVALDENPAVQLFVERARAVSPSFVIEAGQAPAVVRLVRLLDGLPLAIELAAARVRVLSPQGILDRMGRRFDVLKGAGGPSDRQATLRRAIDGSWELLDEPGRAALAQLSVFEAGFDLDAVEAVIDLSAWPDAPWAMDVLEALVDQSLVRSNATPDGGRRFSLLQSIRDYASEKLTDRAEVRRRHAAWYARWGERDALDSLRSGPVARQALQADLENVIAASRSAAGLGDGALAARLALGALAILASSGPLSLAVELGQGALGAGPSPELSARLSVALGEVRSRAGQPEEAAAALERALAQARALGDRRLEGAALAGLGRVSLLRGSVGDAQEQLNAALALHRASRDSAAEADTLTDLVNVVGLRQQNVLEAQALLDGALRIYEAQGDRAGLATALSYQGALSGSVGDLLRSRDAYSRARDLARQVGDRRTEGLCEGMLANVHIMRGEDQVARPHLEAALRIQGSIGDRVHEALHAMNYGVLLSRLGERSDAAQQLERAVALSIANRDPRTEGQALGRLGMLQAMQGDLARARETRLQGLARLEAARDRSGAAGMRCEIGKLELQLGHRDQAQCRLDEARRAAAELGPGASRFLLAAIEDLAARLAKDTI